MGTLPNAEPVRRPKYLGFALAAIVFVVTGLAFSRAINAGFCDFDDFAVLFEVQGYRGLAASNIAWDFSVFHMGHFQPLTWMSYGLDYVLRGMDADHMDARGFHLTNILLHAANAAVLFFVAARLIAAGRKEDWPSLGTLLGAGAAALFFGLSPLRVESVAWITERRDVLSTFFLLLSVLWYLRAFPPGAVAASKPGRYWASVGLLVLSLLAKSWGMSLFVVLTVLDIYPLRRLPADPRQWNEPSRRAVLLQKLPFAVLGVAAAITAAKAQSAMPDTAKTLGQWGPVERIVQALYGLFFYAWKTIAPARLSALYDLPVKLDPLAPRFLMAYAALAGATVVIWVLRRRIPGLLAAAACYAVLVAPVLGVFQSGIQFVADRYSYVACMGWAVMVGALVATCVRGRPAPKATAARGSQKGLVAAVASVAVGAVFVAGTRVQIGYWTSTLTLFEHAVEVGWDGPTLRQYYAHQLELHQDVKGAEEQYRLSVDMNPAQGMSWFALGNILRDRGALAEAEHAYIEAAKSMYEPWRANTALGLLYLSRMDRPADAVAVLRKAVKEVESPDRPAGTTPGGGGWPYFLLAGALDETGDPKGSRAMLEIAAQYPETRAKALERIPEVDAELRGGR